MPDLYRIKIQGWTDVANYSNNILVVASCVPEACEKVTAYMILKNHVEGVRIDNVELVDKDVLL